ncbi:hypothetical protein [Fodinicurvata sediminis]|uniref:hypothetical protein n=1 Tax=Fodinicurvata sediminis TaxID=1121832 RepID=UPI0012DF2971|nr:hypothetical protein [Fodinicurvata sediminis]
MDIVTEIAIGIAIGIFTGLVSGTYTGLVVARYTRFRDLRDEALRVVRGIEYCCVDDESVRTISGYNHQRMLDISSDLIAANQKKVSQNFLDLDKELLSTISRAKNNGIAFSEMKDIDKKAQKKVRKATPSRLTLLSPWPEI